MITEDNREAWEKFQENKKKWIHIGKAEIGQDCDRHRNCKNYDSKKNPVKCCGPFNKEGKGTCRDNNCTMPAIKRNKEEKVFKRSFN